MKSLRSPLSKAAEQAPVPRGVQRLVRDVETGRFERTLSGPTAAGALVTGAEIYLEHDRASFGNPGCGFPSRSGPSALPRGIAQRPGGFKEFRYNRDGAAPLRPAARDPCGRDGPPRACAKARAVNPRARAVNPATPVKEN